MHVPRAFVHRVPFEKAVAKVARRLKPDVVRIEVSLGEDWTGEPAVFFVAILTDAASQRDNLFRVGNKVSDSIVRQVAPFEEWGVRPYFSFRSQSEQAELDASAA